MTSWRPVRWFVLVTIGLAVALGVRPISAREILAVYVLSLAAIALAVLTRLNARDPWEPVSDFERALRPRATERVRPPELVRLERELTLATADRMFQALAWEANARLAMAETDLARAADCVAKAVDAMDGFEVPLAAWRVHATAAELAQRAGDEALAAHNRELSRATILKLANSLPAEEPLRNTFLSAPSVSKVLGNAERSSQIGSSRPPASTTSTFVSVGHGKRRTRPVEYTARILFRKSP